MTVPFAKVVRGYIVGITCLTMLAMVVILMARSLGLFTQDDVTRALSFLTHQEFLIFLCVGFCAQLVDGSLGMAYGVISSTLLVSLGTPPVVASAGVHIAEIFTTAASGISHWRFGNVDFKLLRMLAIPGAIGAAIGAYLLSAVDASVMRPLVAAYMLVMGMIILRKAFVMALVLKKQARHVGWIGLVGGFADASGGGGWGPIVTSTLIGSGNHPKTIIGTVNASEFLVALMAAGTFTFILGSGNWAVVLGLIIGGVLAAPLGAFVCHRINVRVALGIVGVLVIFLSSRTLLKALDIL